MSIISKITVFEKPEQHVLSLRTTIQFKDYPKTAKHAYEKIMEYAMQKNLRFSNCPFVCYHNTDLDNLDVEIGFPVANPIVGNGDIVGHTISAQHVVSGIFLGAYQDSDLLMIEMIKWIKEHGFEQLGTICNYYLNDEERNENELLTQIVIPIK